MNIALMDIALPAETYHPKKHRTAQIVSLVCIRNLQLFQTALRTTIFPGQKIILKMGGSTGM